jgi:hypothetical protein
MLIRCKGTHMPHLEEELVKRRREELKYLFVMLIRCEGTHMPHFEEELVKRRREVLKCHSTYAYFYHKRSLGERNIMLVA